jgi:hypothetical protein
MANKKLFFLDSSKLFTLQNLCVSIQIKASAATFSDVKKRTLLFYFNDRVKTAERIHFG